MLIAVFREIYATCSWACHDHGCTHGSGGLLEESAIEAIYYLQGSDLLYRDINLLLFVLGLPSAIALFWSLAFGIKPRWPLLFAGAILIATSFQPSLMYDLGVEITIALANLSPLSYIEMSGLLFVFLMPLAAVSGFSTWIWRGCL